MLVIRPEAVRLVGTTDRPNTVRAVVREVRFHGDRRAVMAETATGIRLTASVAPAIPADPGDEVHLELPPAACRVLPTGTTAQPDERGAACVTDEPTSHSTGSS